MFEDISDPSRNAIPNWGDTPPIDSDEASRAARFWAGAAFVLVALDSWVDYKRLASADLLRNLVFLGFLALVWLFRSEIAAALACLMTPLFWFGGMTRWRGVPVDNYYRTRGALILLGACVIAAWSCHRYHRFKMEESALPPDSNDGVGPA